MAPPNILATLIYIDLHAFLDQFNYNTQIQIQNFYFSTIFQFYIPLI